MRLIDDETLLEARNAVADLQCCGIGGKCNDCGFVMNDRMSCVEQMCTKAAEVLGKLLDAIAHEIAQPKVMTRFDQIKATFSAFTAEEFAEDMDFDMEEFIEKNREWWCSAWCDKNNCSYGHGESHKYDECIQCRINWLNQEVHDGRQEGVIAK